MLTQLHSPHAAAQWLAARTQGSLRTDSASVRPGDAFIAWPGGTSDGRRFVPQALAAGARACLVEHEGLAAFGFDDTRIASLPGLKAAAGALADEYFGAPSSRLDVLAATGTNGKTSTTWWTAQALTLLGRRCGLIGTLGIGEPPPPLLATAAAAAGGDPTTLRATGLTTPDPVTVHAALHAFAQQGFAACALEASSIGLAQQRLAATRIRVALFTNFTRDHLDYHGSMDAYWAAKRLLFAWPGLRAASINVDDERGAALVAELQGSALDIWSVSTQGPARLRAAGLRHAESGLAFELIEGTASVPLASRLVGDYNASNLLVVIGGLRALGVPLAEAAAAAAQVSPVPGRLQRVAGGDLEVVIDYAHTPDALEKTLHALRPLVAARGARLWCVFGCGGNRDASKRPLMGAIAARGADRVVLTSDNPRFEAPGAILAQILAGVLGHDEIAVIEDRRAAIEHAVRSAQAGDVILLAGKGHESYQEIAGIQRPFSDAAEARGALARRAAAGAAGASGVSGAGGPPPC